MRRAGLLLLAAFGAGCATAVPLQTASTGQPGAWRVGGAVSTAAWCGDMSGLLGMVRCTEYPDGVPLPEVRALARRGVAPGTDVGASVQVAVQTIAPERPLQVGGTLEVKRELVRAPSGSVTHVLSLGAVAGGAVSGRVGLAPWWSTELSVPLLYGLQWRRFEWVAGVALVGRVLLPPTSAAVPLPVTASQRLNLSLGLFRREPASWAVQVSYLTDPARFTNGALQVQFGWLFDLAPE